MKINRQIQVALLMLVDAQWNQVTTPVPEVRPPLWFVHNRSLFPCSSLWWTGPSSWSQLSGTCGLWFLCPNKTHWKLSQNVINWEIYRFKEGPVLMTEHCLKWRKSNTCQVQGILWLSLQFIPGLSVRKYCWPFNSRIDVFWVACGYLVDTHIHRVRIRHGKSLISHLATSTCSVSLSAQ